MTKESQHSKPKHKRTETSKVILIFLLTCITLLISYSIYISIIGNTEPLIRCIEGTFALTSISIGFYYWKAKAENLHKYHQDNKITMNGENEL